MNKPLSVGFMIAAALVLLALILPLTWAGFRKWRARWLSPEERLLIRCAYKSQGMIQIVQSDQFPGGWVRSGGMDFDADPRRAALFIEALNHLLALGHVEETTENSFVLTHSGWRHAGKRLVL